MSSKIEFLKKGAHNLAKGGELHAAQEIVKTLPIYGLPPEEVMGLRNSVALTYLQGTSKPLEWGIVDHFDYRHATVQTEYEQHIGLSPYPREKFLVEDFVYYKHGKSRVVMFEVEEEWFYINFNSHQNYGGRVVTYRDGKAWVIPYFDLTSIEAQAQECIDSLEGRGNHKWGVPKYLTTEAADYALLRIEQTVLALKSLGLESNYYNQAWQSC